MDKFIDEAVNYLQEAEHAVVFTGSGISAESGISTFRGEDGLWERYNPEEVASIYGFRKNPAAFWHFARDLFLKSTAFPNPGHEALAQLEKMDVIKAVITQNIDMLHQKAGSQNVLELHGSLDKVDCLNCTREFNWDHIASVLEKDCPVCESCGSKMLKPRIVFFGEALPAGTLKKAREETEKSDVFLVVGSSLEVYPAAGFPDIARYSGAKTILINKDITGLEDMFHTVIKGKAGEVLPRLAEACI